MSYIFKTFIAVISFKNNQIFLFTKLFFKKNVKKITELNPY